MPDSSHDEPYTQLLAHRTAGLPTIRTDIASFASSGRGVIAEPAAIVLRAGDRLAVTDDGADTLAAEVLTDPVAGWVEVRIDWDAVLAADTQA